MSTDNTSAPAQSPQLASPNPAQRHVQLAKRVMGVSILASIAAAISLGFLPPTPASLDIPAPAHRIGVFITSLFSLFYIAAAILFVLGLKDFKPRLRRAYGVICAGLVLLGLNFLQYPVFNILDIWDRAWFAEGCANVPYIVALVLAYAGIRRFAAILDVQSAWNSIGFVSLLTVGAGVLGYGLSHGPLALTDTPLNVTVATEFSLLALAFATFYLTLRIKQSTGRAYTNALAWFSIALLAQIFAVLVPTLFEITSTEKGAILGISALITAGLYVRAGYVFNKINTY